MFLIISTLIFIVFFKFKNTSFPDIELAIIFILFLISTPKEYFLGKKTPFKIITDTLTKSFNYKKNLELYRAITQLKNLAIAKNEPVGADFILQQIIKFTKVTRPVFNKMYSLWIEGKKNEACNYFERAINTKEAKELASIFRKLDVLEPLQLKNQLVLYQDSVKRQRETAKLQKSERNSNIVYTIVAISSMLVLINFLVVVYFIDTLNYFRILF